MFRKKKKNKNFKEINDDNEDEIEIYKEVAEKLGKEVWSITQEDINDYKKEKLIEEKKEIEEEEEESDEEEENENKEIEDKKEKVNEITESINENTSNKKYPIIKKITNEITQYIEEIDLESDDIYNDKKLNNDFPSNLFVSSIEELNKIKENEEKPKIHFFIEKNTYEYPREFKEFGNETKTKMELLMMNEEKKNNNKKDYEEEKETIKKKKEKNNNDNEDELTYEEEMKLKEIRRKREEFAIVQKAKQEEEEKRKKEIQEKKDLEQKNKKDYKPKKKKKKK